MLSEQKRPVHAYEQETLQILGKATRKSLFDYSLESIDKDSRKKDIISSILRQNLDKI